jgi:hypothetical protein
MPLESTAKAPFWPLAGPVEDRREGRRAPPGSVTQRDDRLSPH